MVVLKRELATIEFDLLATFLSHLGRAWSRAYWVAKLWGNDFFGAEQVVDSLALDSRESLI